MLTVINFIQRAVLQGTPLLYGATGEILTEKSGNLNLGIPGIMYIGAIFGLAARVAPLLLPDRNTQSKSKCYGSCNYHLRRGLR